MISCAAEQIAYKKCQKSWGGATLFVPTNQFVADGTHGYVFAIGPSIEIPENADYFEFRGAVAKLEADNPDAEYFGFFHDNAKRTIDLNPVMFVKTRAEVDAAYNGGVDMPGGAYELHTGDGYWPQGRPELYKTP
jgi:hypothetical protein